MSYRIYRYPEKSCEICGQRFAPRKPTQRTCGVVCKQAILRPSLAERFWSRVAKTDGCWEWRGLRSRYGHGMIGVGGHRDGAHRVSWQLHNGPIPKGIWVLHHCDNPPCVRPDHLFLGTARDNSQDMVRKGRSANQHTRRASIDAALPGL